MDSFFLPIIIAGALAGMGLGLLGVYIVGMRMPFIGSCISHTAMVGAVYGSLLGVNPTLGALALSMAGSAGVAFIRTEKRSLGANTAQAILLSFMMGLAFLAVGLEQDSRNEMLSLLWGNVLFADWSTVLITSMLTTGLILFVILFDRPLRAILFSRPLAEATCLYSRCVYLAFLLFCGLILAVNLKTVGGLLIFSLLVCPAATAYRIARGYRAVVIIAMLSGTLAAITGFAVSYYINLPTGACIVITSAALYTLTCFLPQDD